MFEIKKKERNIDTYDDILCNTSSHIYIYIYLCKKKCFDSRWKKNYWMPDIFSCASYVL